MDILTKLGINGTFFVQVINFVILVLILNKVLYKPLIKTIKDRTDKIKQGLELTDKLDKQFRDLEKTKSEIIEAAQKESSIMISNAEKKAEDKSVKLIEETKKRGEEMIKDYEKSLQKERELLEKEINDKVYESVKLVLKKVMASDKEIDKSFITSTLDE